MGIDGLQFDILDLLKEDVAHLPRPQRRKELARGVAQNFLQTAEGYDLSGGDRPSSS